MEKPAKFDSIQPRFLRYRSHYKIYLVLLLTISGLILSFWGHQLSQNRWQAVYLNFSNELWISCCFFAIFGSFYFFWLRSRLSRAVQVYPEKLCVHNNGQFKELHFENVESVGVVCWSLFYFKMKDGHKYYFNSSLERVDYIWEGVYASRPDLMSEEDFNSFRTKLVQYDHHQKRKDWFFRHKLLDVLNWVILPISFLCVTYFIQSRDVVVNQEAMYFFRLFMYSALVLMITTFTYSIILKRFIFDKRVKVQMSSHPDDKLRDIDFEGIVLHRSKLLQLVTTAFFFALIVRTEVNLFSVTKIKEDLSSFNFKSGSTLVVDNRFNCLACKYPVRDGDVVVFGRGTLGQIMATEGDMVGQISQDTKGRIIASENIQEVPKGHIAIKLANHKEIVMVKVGDLIGKIQK